MEPISLKTIHEDLSNLRKDVQFIKHLIAEDFDLSKQAKKQLEEARKTPRTEYLNHQDIEKEFLR